MSYTAANLPTYSELAQALTNLIEHSVANIDSPENRFVRCYTYGANAFMGHPQKMKVYLDAVRMRAVLKKENIVV